MPPATFILRLLAFLFTDAATAAIYTKSGSGDNKSSTWIGSDGSLSHSTTVNGKTTDYYIGD